MTRRVLALPAAVLGGVLAAFIILACAAGMDVARAQPAGDAAPLVFDSTA